MCGIAGFWDCNTFDKVEIARKMAAKISHRGPDDCGFWTENAFEPVLVHTRLSIQDLSAAGHQPMASQSGRYVISFNGEIYNHNDLRSDLSAFQWKGHSDTETLLAGFEAWGIKKTICKTIGMFAIAVWDRHEKKLTLIRDRTGEKPLYYGWQNSTFLFGSELKSMRVHPLWQGDINRQALTLYLRHNCIPAPYSIYTGILKLMPGTMVTLPWNETGPIVGNLPEPETYWNPIEIAINGQAALSDFSEREAVEALDKLLRQAVTSQMLSDVPLGAFLSGGVDSSLIAALMQVQSSKPVKTFSIGFNETEFDEAPYARAVAKHLGTEHHEMYVSDSDARSVIPELHNVWDEPFSDSSQIPTLLLCRLTKQSVTVSLSGDAGDELFGGYNRYTFGPKLWGKLRIIPMPVKKLGDMVIRTLPATIWDTLGYPFRKSLGTQVADKMQKIAATISCKGTDDLYHVFTSHWLKPEQVVLNGSEPLTLLTNGSGSCLKNFTDRMMLSDLRTYLPDDILVKVDRAAMSTSLETRVPFLDHRVVEFAWNLPLPYKIRNGQGKWILRQVLDRYVPKHLIDRPKKGFGVPLASWLRKPLRDWAETLLAEDRLRCEGYFNPKPVRRAWVDHLSGKSNMQHHLWDILMFQTWLEEQKRITK